MSNAEKSGITSSSPKSIVFKFIKIINEGNSKKLMEMQTKDFEFIDKKGDKFVGKDGWSDYFSSYPEYKIHMKQILTNRNGVAIIGTTTGSHVPPELEKQETILWLAHVENDLVSKWHIFGSVNKFLTFLGTSLIVVIQIFTFLGISLIIVIKLKVN